MVEQYINLHLNTPALLLCLTWIQATYVINNRTEKDTNLRELYAHVAVGRKEKSQVKKKHTFFCFYCIPDKLFKTKQ